jgi:hypothetical protein
VRESCREMDDFELDEDWVRAGGVDADAELEVDDSALASPHRLDLSIAGIVRHRREFKGPCVLVLITVPTHEENDLSTPILPTHPAAETARGTTPAALTDEVASPSTVLETDILGKGDLESMSSRMIGLRWNDGWNESGSSSIRFRCRMLNFRIWSLTMP